MLAEALSCLLGESQQLGVLEGHDRNSVALGFRRQCYLELPLWDKQCGWIAAAALQACSKQPADLERRRFFFVYGQKRRAKDKSACCAHECDTVKVAILLGTNGVAI